MSASPDIPRDSKRPAKPETAEALMELCRLGDQSAFRNIVERHQEYAFALAFRFLCESEEAKDVVQESFVRVWTHRADYDPRKKFTTWMYKIVVNLCYDRLRANQRRERVFSNTDNAGEVAGEEPNPEELAVNRDLAERIFSLVESLPEKQRVVFTLRDLHDQSVEEVAAIVGISAESVRTHLCYARSAIRTKLERRE